MKHSRDLSAIAELLVCKDCSKYCPCQVTRPGNNNSYNCLVITSTKEAIIVVARQQTDARY